MSKNQLLILSIVGLVTFVIAYALLNQGSNQSYTKSELASMVTGDMKKLTFYDQPQPLPDFPIQIADGTVMPLSAMKGRVLFINLWASWCAPCRAEMHDIAVLQQQLGGDDFTVVAINQDIGGLKRADRTLKEWKVEGLDLYADKTMTTGTKMAGGRLPKSFIVDKHGRMLAEYSGVLKWDSAESIQLLQALIDQ